MSAGVHLDQNGQFIELPLSHDDLIGLETLVQSPAYRLLQRVCRLYTANLVSGLLAEKDEKSSAFIKGQVQGLRLIENLPLIHAEHAKALRKKSEQAEKKPVGKPMRSPISQVNSRSLRSAGGKPGTSPTDA